MPPNRDRNRIGFGCLPFKTHPLFTLRKITLWTILPGALLSLVAAANDGPGFLYAFFLFLVSTAVIVWDLVSYGADKLHHELMNARRQIVRQNLAGGIGVNENAVDVESQIRSSIAQVAHHDDGTGGADDDGGAEHPIETDWPTKKLLIAECVLTVLWFCTTALCFAIALSPLYYYGASVQIAVFAYAALSALFMLVLHAVAFWRELLARMARRLRGATGARLRCPRCGESVTNGHFVGEHGEAGETVDATPEGEVYAVTVPRLPRWLSFGNGRKSQKRHYSKARGDRDDSGQLVDIEADADSSNSETSMLITPALAEGSANGKIATYNTLADSVASLNEEAETVVKKMDKRKKSAS